MKRNPYLRVKLKSLAAEAKIIRTEERRANAHKDYYLQNGLRDHRVRDVRSESRHTLLAYQFLRGIPYAAVESPREDNQPTWTIVHRMIVKYGVGMFRLSASDVADWGQGKATKILSKAA